MVVILSHSILGWLVMQQEITKTISLNVFWNSGFSLRSYLLPLPRPPLGGLTSLATEAHSITGLCLLSSFIDKARVLGPQSMC